jgi:UDP-glucose 4-epimerase
VTILDPKAPDALLVEHPGRVEHDGRTILEFLAADHDSKFSSIIHLAWSSHPATSMQFPLKDLDANVGSGIRLLERCKTLGVSRFVFASSGGTVYGALQKDRADEAHPTNPVSVYGATKLSLEHYAQVIANRDGFDAVSLRVSNPFGQYQLQGVAVGSIANFLRAVRDGRRIVLFGDGSIVRDYISIEDVATAFNIAVSFDCLPSGPYNVASGIGTTLTDIVALVEDVSGQKLGIDRQPDRAFDVPRNVLDCTRFETLTGWRTMLSLREGVEAMWNSLIGKG